MLAYLRSQAVLYEWIAIALGLLGIGVCVTGFWLWYARLQRYLDADVAKGR